jgi:hypothetical protein
MAVISGPDVVTDGLVLALDAANPKSYPGSGTVWRDVSGNGNTGTLVNGVGYDSSSLGSLVFDGSNDNATVPHSASYKVNVPMTITAWVRSNDPASGGDIISTDDFNCQSGGLGSNRYRGVTFNYSPTGIGTNIGNGGTCGSAARKSYTISFPSTVGTNWSYIVLRINAIQTDVRFFLNGADLGIPGTSGTGSHTQFVYTNDQPMTIGSRINFVSHFDGDISSIQIYNKGLSNQEIQQNFEATRGRYGI